MSINELNKRVQDLRELRRMAEELTTEMESIQDEIKAYMTAQGMDELSGTDYKVTWKEVQSKRFDKKAMIQTFGQDCYNEFCKTTTCRRFTVA